MASASRWICSRLVRCRAPERCHEGAAQILGSITAILRSELGDHRGIDWSERHHDVTLVDDDGVLIAKRRIPDSAAGFRQLLELLAEHRERSDAPIPVAIETAKGLLPAALRAAGYQLFPINPLAVSRYRDRYAVSRAKSDPGDALVLANILRTDRPAHQPAASGQRARRQHPGAGPCPAGRGPGSPTGGEQAAVTIARVLPQPVGRV